MRLLSRESTVRTSGARHALSGGQRLGTSQRTVPSETGVLEGALASRDGRGLLLRICV